MAARSVRLGIDDIIEACKAFVAVQFDPLPEGHTLSADICVDKQSHHVSVNVWVSPEPEVK